MVEENKNLLAYCGLYCGDCFAYKGKIAFFEVFKNYKQSYDVLGAMVKFRCKRACKGEGNLYSYDLFQMLYYFVCHLSS